MKIDQKTSQYYGVTIEATVNIRGHTKLASQLKLGQNPSFLRVTFKVLQLKLNQTSVNIGGHNRGSKDEN